MALGIIILKLGESDAVKFFWVWKRRGGDAWGDEVLPLVHTAQALATGRYPHGQVYDERQVLLGEVAGVIG